MGIIKLTQVSQKPTSVPAGEAHGWSDSADNGRVKFTYPDGRTEILSPTENFDNVLINGDFRFAQRQDPATLTTYSNTTGRTYGADRWGVTNENASVQYKRVDTQGSPETGLQARFYGVYKKITSTGKMIVSQVVEGIDMMPLRGRTVRVQAKLKRAVAGSMKVRLGLLYLTASGTVDSIPATFVSAFGAASTDPTWGTNLTAIAPTYADGGTVVGNAMDCTLAATWGRFSACFAVPSTAKNLVVVIFSDAGAAANDELHISEVGLYDGESILDWSPRLHQRELALCQRFCQKSFNVDTAPVQNNTVNTGEFKFIAGIAGTGAERSHLCAFPVRMRAAPTITRYNPAAASAEVRDETAAANCTATATAGITEAGFAVTCTGAAGTTVGGLLGLHWLAEAEL